MEAMNGISIFMAGLALGLIGAHYLNKQELKLEYERGVLDTCWELQRISMQEHLARVLGTAGNKEASGADSSKEPV